MKQNQKKSQVEANYDAAYKQHLRLHKQNIQRAGFRIIAERELNRQDRSQQFYKIFERQFRSSLMVKHGYKIAQLQIEEQDLALYCFSLFQAQAAFPLKIFTIDHSKGISILDMEQSSRKDLWMQTNILVSSLTNSSQNQLKFQTKIYDFFNEQFMKRRINWDYMVTKQYTDEKVIAEFQVDVIEPANKQFKSLFH